MERWFPIETPRLLLREHLTSTVAKHAFIIGGTGQIGLAATDCFLDAGWSVTAAHRSGRSFQRPLDDNRYTTVELDRDEAGALKRAVPDGAEACCA